MYINNNCISENNVHLMWRLHDTERRIGRRERDAEEQWPAGTSTTQRHDGRIVPGMRHLPQSLDVAADRSRRRQDEARPSPTEDMQKPRRKHQQLT